MHELDQNTLKRLIDGDLSDHQLREDILPDPKDVNRFETIRAIHQQRVDWDDPILVPLNDHLFVVGTEDGRIVKGECGHEFCSVEENWKLRTEVRVREGNEDIAPLYSEDQAPDPDWEYELREFLCPECYQLLEVEAVPRGYPIQQKFEPDIDTFYEEWLKSELPDASLKEA